MTEISLHNTTIAGLATTVPPVSHQTQFEGVGDVMVRRCTFDQTTSDLAYDAAERVLTAKQIDREEIGFLLFLSRTPDYRSPTTAAILQGRLNLSIDCICYDINVGSNGFTKGIGIGSSILQSINKPFGLIVLGDTPSKLQHENVFFSSIESDAASAVLIEKDKDSPTGFFLKNECLSSNFKHFAIPKGGFRFYGQSENFDSTKKDNFELIFDKEAISTALLPWFADFTREIETHLPAYPLVIQTSLLSLMEISSPFTDQTLAMESLQSFGNTYGSSIPLQLGLYKNQHFGIPSVQFQGISFGEGLELSLMGLKIDTSTILPTLESAQIFDDFRVNHEI